MSLLKIIMERVCSQLGVDQSAWPQPAFPLSLTMLIRALKRLLPQVPPAAAAPRSEACYGPKSLETLKAETRARRDVAHDAYVKAFQEGRRQTAFGHLSEVLRQYDALVALNTGAWSRVDHVKTAPLKAPSQVSMTPKAAASQRASAGVLKADAAAGIGDIRSGGVAIQSSRASRADAGLGSAVDGADASIGISETFHLGT